MEFGNTVAAVLTVMRDENKQYKDYLPQEAITAGEKLVEITKNLWDDVRKTIVELVHKEIPMQYPYVAVWWYSVLVEIEKDEDIFNEFIAYVRNNRRAFSANTQYFLYYQLKNKLFVYSNLDGQETKRELWRYFIEVVNEFSEKVHASLQIIPEKDRNENLILVITEQFLGVNHGPTKTALDRCKAIKMVLNKSVLLINTAEIASSVGEIPYMGTGVANYRIEKLHECEQSWKGVKIPYYQCENNMPDINELDKLLEKIRELAPLRVISIGGSGILSNLVNRIIPVLTIGLCPSDLEFTTTQYQTLGRKLQSTDTKLLSELKFPTEHVIESTFTSGLKTQTEHITRSDLQIPDDKFLMCVVGGRLNMEVTDAFLSAIEKIMQDDMYLVFWGYFDKYEESIERYSRLKKNSSYLGFCQDILSRLDICDLYVNPVRKGGGTSCVEAMYKGVPVVSVNYGDVAVNAGEDFLVGNYEEMQKVIQRYHDDKDFYNVMSDKAKKRAAVLMDTETEFVNIMLEVDRREKMREEKNGTGL